MEMADVLAGLDEELARMNTMVEAFATSVVSDVCRREAETERDLASCRGAARAARNARDVLLTRARDGTVWGGRRCADRMEALKEQEQTELRRNAALADGARTAHMRATPPRVPSSPSAAPPRDDAQMRRRARASRRSSGPKSRI